ncbi:MAG: hypothetical protein Q8L48_00035 [Archangium sp.]|nr:hypothetical protein [Archangium sp.]
MKKPAEEFLAVVVALAILGLLGMAFVSFVTVKGDFQDSVPDGGTQATAK